jgi:hypothetical protein
LFICNFQSVTTPKGQSVLALQRHKKPQCTATKVQIFSAGCHIFNFFFRQKFVSYQKSAFSVRNPPLWQQKQNLSGNPSKFKLQPPILNPPAPLNPPKGGSPKPLRQVRKRILMYVRTLLCGCIGVGNWLPA